MRIKKQYSKPKDTLCRNLKGVLTVVDIHVNYFLRSFAGYKNNIGCFVLNQYSKNEMFISRTNCYTADLVSHNTIAFKI